jgi:hypothetical protein
MAVVAPVEVVEAASIVTTMPSRAVDPVCGSACLLLAALALTACGGSTSGQPFAADSGFTPETAGPGGDSGASDVVSMDATPEAEAGCASVVCDGVCVQAASCAFSVTSVSPTGGPMNGANFITLKGHGFAAGMQVHLGDGRAVVRVLDPATALIQPPPGPHQVVDVTVALASNTAVLPQSYRYESGSLGNTWEKKPLSTPRGVYPGLSLLQDGRMLISGGAANAAEVPVTSAEIYDPTTGVASLVGSSMSVARFEHAAVTLMTGKVLLAGNWGTPTAVADLFDPTSNTFAPSASMLTTARAATIGVLLVDGRVLLMSNATPSAEIYDPVADQFSAVAGAPVLTDDYDQPWPVRLRDGRVLVVKGSGRPCYFFDSDTDTFTMAGAGPQTVFIWNSPLENGVHVLPDGRVAVIGGNQAPIFTPISTIELFDPATSTAFAPAPYTLTAPREAPGTALLRDGTVIVIGGVTAPSPQARSCNTTFSVTSAVDVIDPVGAAVSSFAALPDPNWTLGVATLLDGSLVAAGGTTCGGAVSYPYMYFMQGTALQ